MSDQTIRHEDQVSTEKTVEHISGEFDIEPTTEKTEMENFVASFRCELFSEQKTVAQAYKYAELVIEGLESSEKIHVLTALHVMMNTMGTVALDIYNRK